jgi:ABC-type Zn uptake system ZnuABC Zn-binding protein ZnuA
MKYRVYFLILGLLSFSSLLNAKELKVSCSHPEVCNLMTTIAEEQGTHIEVESIVSISGDPHEFEPSITELKKLMGAAYLIEGPNELNPWIKKVNYQRSKNSNLVTKTLSLLEQQVSLYSSTSNGHTKEALAHFWLYPKIYCNFKSDLTRILVETNIIVLKNKNDDQCFQKAVETEKQLRLILSQMNMPIVLTHDALWPLLNSLNEKKNSIVAIKGSGHHEEASTDSVKKLYDALKAPRVIWIEEKGINIPPSVLNKKRPTDIVLKLDTATSFGKDYFSVIKKLNDELSQLKGKK